MRVHITFYNEVLIKFYHKSDQKHRRFESNIENRNSRKYILDIGYSRKLSIWILVSYD